MQPPLSSKRMQREARTVEVMLRLFCRDRHQAHGVLCRDCQELLAYAHRRLHLCPFQEHKTTCGKCPAHCYTTINRNKIKEVMRYAGPRMLLSHPILALAHLLDGLRTPRSKG